MLKYSMMFKKFWLKRCMLNSIFVLFLTNFQSNKPTDRYDAYLEGYNSNELFITLSADLSSKVMMPVAK